MNQMMGQEPDRLLPIGPALDPAIDGGGEVCDNEGLIGQASRAVPVDGIDMGIDLQQPLDGTGGLPVIECRESLEA